MIQNSRAGFLQSPTGHITLLVVVVIVVLMFAWRDVF